MNADARVAAARVDPFARVVGVIAVAVDIDRDAGCERDLDGLGGSLLWTEPAGEEGLVPGRRRPRDRPGWDMGRQYRLDGNDPAPGPRLKCGHACNRRRRIAPRHNPKR